jgi:hypothetical protein
MLHQIPVPLPFVGRTYGELLSALLLVQGTPGGGAGDEDARAPADRSFCEQGEDAPGGGAGFADGGFEAADDGGPAPAPPQLQPAPWAHEVPLGLLRHKSENRGWR